MSADPQHCRRWAPKKLRRKQLPAGQFAARTDGFPVYVETHFRA